MSTLSAFDPEAAQAIAPEKGRQQNKLELMVLENFVSKAVMGSPRPVLTNKYVEGHPVPATMVVVSMWTL